MIRSQLVVRRLALAGLCLASLGLVGCGDDGGQANGQPAPRTVPTTSAEGGPSSTAGTTTDYQHGQDTSEQKYTVAEPPPEEFRPPDDTSGAPATLPLEARITPPCVVWGETVTFELKTKPGAEYAMQVKWPNEQFSELPNTYGTADDNGGATWSLEVDPTALTGEAHLMVAVIEPQSGEPGASGDFRFLVGRPGRC